MTTNPTSLTSPKKRMRHDDTTLPLSEQINEEEDNVKPNAKHADQKSLQKLPFEQQVMQNSTEQFVPELEIRDVTNHVPRPNIIAPPQIHRINSSSTSSR